MTKHGNKIPGVTIEQVREQLAEETDPKAIKRLTAAREYLDGLSPADIETKYGWHEQTVYGWLNRFEERGFEAALYDDKSPGREPELTDEQFQQFAEALNQPPEQAGYDEPAWTSALAQQHLIAEFDVTYSRRHVQRLMKMAEVSWKKPRPDPSSADEEELEQYDEDLQKKSVDETTTRQS
jgi:transposase